jgi:hypothetical protein
MFGPVEQIATEKAIASVAEYLILSGKSVYTVRRYERCLWNLCELFDCGIDRLVRNDQRCISTFEQLQNSDQRWQVKTIIQSHKTALAAYRKFTKANNLSRDSESRDNFQQPLPEGMKWYPQIIVVDIKTLKQLICATEKSDEHSLYNGNWIFRGQGNAKWKLETSLYRVADREHCGGELKVYENESMWEFGREASKEQEYRDFKGLNLLALMQHYGCKTRLLDFSLSPYVALYMAIDQYEKEKECRSVGKKEGAQHTGDSHPSLALWAINLNVLCKIEDGASWKQVVVPEFDRGESIVAKHVDSHGLGVTVVFPKVSNRRISAQDGLFLMPKSLDYSFEANLCATLGMGRESFTEKKLSDPHKIRAYLKGGVCKFIIRPDKIGELKLLLRDANVTARTVYPDLTGLSKYVTSFASKSK